MKRLFLSLIFTALLAFSVSAQNIRIMFDQAKELFDSQRYALALGRFKQISQLDEDNDLVRYATYYEAISAYNSGDANTAKNIFLRIEDVYPDWQIEDELDFWLAKIFFEQGDVHQALSRLESVQSPKLEVDKQALKAKFLSQVSDTTQLRVLLEKYQEPVIAQNLLSALLKVNVMDQDLDRIQALMDTYHISPNVDLEGIEVSPKKEVYNIGLFFPFMYQGDSMSTVRMMKDWPIRFLEGMKLGVEKLKEEGVKVNLLAFDTRTSASVTRSILSDPALKELDLIVGPAYSGPTSEVAKFAKENKINMVNPLSSNGEILVDNPFAFLYYPSNESLAIAAANYAKSHFKKNKTAAIFYATDADWNRAELYRKLIEKDSFNVVIYEMVRPDESVKIQQMLVEEVKVDKDSAEVASMIAEMDTLLAHGESNWEIYNENDFMYDALGILADSIGHIFIASDVPSLSASAISGIDARPDSIKFIGSTRWLSAEQSLSFEQLERVDAVFTSANWIHYDDPKVKEFRERFINEYNTNPRKEERLGDAYLGYDIMVSYGRMLHDHGKYFQIALKSKAKTEGELTEGFKYQLTNDNRYIPILRMVDSELRTTKN